jgi:hypothetical protein
MSQTDKTCTCPRCGKYFKQINDCKQHINAKHGGNGEPQRTTREYDESFAERAIQAELNIAMGLGSDDSWLLP